MFTVQSLATRPLSVLVVEDNRDGADAMAMFLRYCGHSVRLAYDGCHAIEAVRARTYDAVLCDIGLPGKSGYEVAKEIRRLCGQRPLLVALTAYDTPLVRETAQAAGFDYFVTKPADPNEVDHLLQEHTGQLPATGEHEAG